MMREDGKEGKVSIWIAILAVLAAGVAGAVARYSLTEHRTSNSKHPKIGGIRSNVQIDDPLEINLSKATLANQTEGMAFWVEGTIKWKGDSGDRVEDTGRTANRITLKLIKIGKDTDRKMQK